jgi:hypothetical protein
MLYWRMRERLLDDSDPTYLPQDQELLAELCAARFEVRPGNVIFVIPKRDAKDGNTLTMMKILGRSPDRADGVVYACGGLGAGAASQGGKKVRWDQPIEYPKRWNRAYV